MSKQAKSEPCVFCGKGCQFVLTADHDCYKPIGWEIPLAVHIKCAHAHLPFKVDCDNCGGVIDVKHIDGPG